MVVVVAVLYGIHLPCVLQWGRGIQTAGGLGMNKMIGFTVPCMETLNFETTPFWYKCAFQSKACCTNTTS